jgi:hypothetical protein
MNIPAKTPFAQSLNHPNNHQTSYTADYHIQKYDYSIADDFGNRKWLLNNLLHRTDGPAIDCKSGKTEWWLNGLRHRANAPAMEWPSGKQEWWFNGELHRENGPAISYEDGSTEWWLNGKQYNEDLYRTIQFFNGINVQDSQH